MTENPFEILQLDPATDDETAVRQAARLSGQASDETARNLIRQAIEQLTASSEQRELHALLTHPRPEYGDPLIDRFIAAFRRPPASGSETPVPELDRQEFAEALRGAMCSALAVCPQPLESVPARESPAEIQRQTAEALWQALVTNPEG